MHDATRDSSEGFEDNKEKASEAEKQLAALRAEIERLNKELSNTKQVSAEVDEEPTHFLSNLKYGAGSTAQVIDLLTEEMNEFFFTLEQYGAGSTAQVITPLDEMRTAFPKALPAVEQFEQASEDVMGLVSDLAGAFRTRA